MKRYREILAPLLAVMLIAITVPINVYATGTEELDGNGISEKILSDENKVSVIQEDRIGGSLNIDEEKQRPIKETEVELSVDVEYSTDNNDNNEKQNEEGNYEAIDKQNVADKQNVVEDLPDSDEEQVLHQILESRISEENMIEGLADGENNIASGKIDEDFGHITWVIDKNGRLTVSGQGDISNSDDSYRAPWYSKRESIISAKVTVTGMTDTSYLFYKCKNLNSVDISGLDTSRVTDMGWMFAGCSSLQTLDVSSFNTSRVTDMGWMFAGCSSLRTLDISSFNTSQVTDMGRMFADCSSLQTLDVSSFNTSQVTNMYHMFRRCGNLTTLDVRGFVTSQVTDMYGMFVGCSSLATLDVSEFVTSQVMDMGWMFAGCSSLSTLDVSGFVTSQVTSMGDMFKDCISLTELNLSNFDMSYVGYMGGEGMLEGCTGLTKIQTPYNVKASIALPIKLNTPDGTVLTELPRNWGYSLMIALEIDIFSATVSLTADRFEYIGSEIKPDVSVVCNGKMLQQGTDYKISYTDNVNSGMATVTITGAGSYTGTLTRTFTIIPKTLSQTAVSSVLSQEYTGKEITPSVTVKEGGKTLTSGRDYTVSYSNNIQPGTADIVITGTGNYIGTKIVHFTITEQKPKKGEVYTHQNVLYKVLTFTDTERTVEAASATKKSITSVNVPDMVEINGYSFQVISIKGSAFKGCTKLKNAKLGKNIVSIGKKAFDGCTALTSVNIPVGVTKLEDSTFNGCKKLKTVSGCNGVTSVGSKVFYRCEKLVTVGSRSKVITLKKVKTIGSSAFHGCKAVKKVNLLSAGLTKINASAFEDCISMTSFSSNSEKLTTVGKKAFQGDKKLATITLKTVNLKKSKVGANAFKGIKSTCKFKVPQKQVDNYRKIFKAKGAGSKIKVSKL